jgi:hypothetical protein
MSSLQVQNTFEPYYAGRNASTTRWTIRKKDGDRVEHVKVDHAASAAENGKVSDKQSA